MSEHSNNGFSNLDVAERALREAAKEFRADGRDEIADQVDWLAGGCHITERRLTVELLPEGEFVSRGMAIMGEGD